MIINDLINDIKSHLELSAEVIPLRGTEINVGEDFKARITLKNTFRNHDEGGASYKNIILQITGTPYAKVVAPNEMRYVVIHVTTEFNNTLPVNKSVTLTDVKFIATAQFTVNPSPIQPIDLGSGELGPPGPLFMEPYARYILSADFDYEELFKVGNKGELLTQIEPAPITIGNR